MTIKKRTITLTGDNVTGAGFLTGVTGVGHASGALGLGSAYGRIEQMRVYGDANTCDIKLVDADGVTIMGYVGIDASGTVAADDTAFHRSATALGGSAVTGAGQGVLGVGVPFVAQGGTGIAPITPATEVITGTQYSYHHPIARSPLRVELSYIAAAAVTVDIFISE
jgi:hypothetical protein